MEGKTLSHKDYRTGNNPIWCRGCGDYGVLKALTQAFAELKIPNHQIAVVSGIGCCSRAPGYIKTYGANTIHGRALTFAQGIKMAKPELTVIVLGGDGDLFSIGAGHLPHAVRRNLDLTVIMFDNHIYAMTKGQVSPTTGFEENIRDLHAPNPPIDPMLDIVAYSVSTKASFIAQEFAFNGKYLRDLIKRGIMHKGFSFINVQSPCEVFNKSEWINALKKERSFRLEEGKPVELPNGESWIHDPSNIEYAFRLAQVPLRERPYYGVFFRGKGIA